MVMNIYIILLKRELRKDINLGLLQIILKKAGINYGKIYYINGFFVSELEAFDLRANNFGFTVTNPSESTLIAFDDFEFIEPISKLKIDEL